MRACLSLSLPLAECADGSWGPGLCVGEQRLLAWVRLHVPKLRGRGWGQRVGPWPWSPPWLPARSVPRGQPLSLLALSVLVCILGPLATSSGGTVRPRETAACAVWCTEQACPESQRAYTCCRPHHCHRRLVFCPVPPCRPVEIGVGRPDPTLFHPLPELGHEVPRHPLPGAVLQQLPTWAFQTPPELELLSPQGGLSNPLAQRLVQPPGQCLTFPCASSVRPTGLEGPRGHRGPCVAKCGGAYVGTGNGLLANIPEKGGEGTGGWTPFLEAHVGHCGPGVGAEMRARPLPQLPARLLSSSVLSSSLSISTCLSTFEIVQRTKL